MYDSPDAEKKMMELLQNVLKDVRYGLRGLRRSPAFTAIAVLSLALGIGANGAIFSFADALLLRPLPVPEPDTVVTVSADVPDLSAGLGALSYSDYRDLREKTSSFTGLAAFQTSIFSIAKSSHETPQLRLGVMVSDSFFHVMGIPMALGQPLLAETGQVPGGDAIVVLTYEFWQGEFSGDPAAIGRTIRINNIEFTMVGVTAKSFTSLDQYVRPQLYLPAMMWQRLIDSPSNPLEDRNRNAFEVKGRLKPGISAPMAQAELATIWKGLEPLHSEGGRSRRIAVRTELQERVRQSPTDAYLIIMLMVLVAVVLLIACANVANLVLGRARTRTREVATKLALGVSRARIVRQHLTESMLLSVLAVAAGFGFAYGGIRFLRTISIPTDIPIVIDPRLDYRVLLFSVLSGLASAIIFGLAPALQCSRTDLVPALKEGGTGQTGRVRIFGRSALVIGQVALSLVLLVATGMLVDAFRKALALNPGFRVDHVLLAEFDTSMVRYSSAQTREFYKNLVDRARTLPGVRNVTLGSVIPLDVVQDTQGVAPEDYHFHSGQQSTRVFSSAVDENYFSVMGIPIIHGRAFTAGDKRDTPLVAVVNNQFARTYWPNQDPIGKRLRLDTKKDQWIQIVGLTPTGRYTFIGESPTPFLYLPFAQNERTRMVLFTDTLGSPVSVASPLREVVRSLDSNQPIFNLRTFTDYYSQRAISVPQMIMEIVATLGAVGLTLALIGLYGLVTYSVARRTREIGVRMAVGASRVAVVKMVLRQGLVLSLVGICVGSLVSVIVARILTASLVGLGAPSSVIYFAVPVALFLVTMVSCYLPARRASHLDPVTTLRYE